MNPFAGTVSCAVPRDYGDGIMSMRKDSKGSFIRYPVPRFLLCLAGENLAVSWAMLGQLRASADCLNLSFVCEFGLVERADSEPMWDLFHGLQAEKIFRISGTLISCKLTPLKEKV